MQSKQRRRERQGGREGAAGSTVTLSLRSEGLALRQITTVHEEVNHFLPEKETGKKMIIAALSQHSQFPKTGIPSRPRINGTVGAGNRKKKRLINIQENLLCCSEIRVRISRCEQLLVSTQRRKAASLLMFLCPSIEVCSSKTLDVTSRGIG